MNVTPRETARNSPAARKVPASLVYEEIDGITRTQ